MTTSYKAKVHFAGPIAYMSGYGEHARYILRFLLKNENKYDLYISPIDWANSTFNLGSLFTDEERRRIGAIVNKTQKYVNSRRTKAALKFDISLQVCVPDEWDDSICEKLIGITAGIETDFMNIKWLNDFLAKCDEVWVVSKHSKYAALRTINVAQQSQGNLWGNIGSMPEESSGEKRLTKKILEKVKVFGFPTRSNESQVDTVDLLQDVDTDFNFLSVNQIGPRKNVELLIKEFIEEFRDNDKVGLVLKSHMQNHSLPDKYFCEKVLQQHIKSQFKDLDYKCKIYLLHGNLTQDELRSLYTHEKIHSYVSTTHGEGFGLPLFEAACAGLPIAATAWSGHMDFLSINDSKGYLFEKIGYELKYVGTKADNRFIHPNMKWAHPRPGSTRKALKACYEKHTVKKKQALKLKSLIFESPKFDKKELEKNIIQRIDLYAEGFTKTFSERKTESLLDTLDFEDGK